MKFTVGTSATTVETLVATDGSGAAIIKEAKYQDSKMSVVIYNGHATEPLYIECGGKTATTTACHPIKADKSYTLMERDLSKISLIAAASNDSVFITISKA